MKNFTIERDGQMAFFNNFRIDYVNNPVLVDNTDGVWKGNLLEFKLNIKDLNKVLLQAIKYQSKRRIKGENVTANMLLVDLNKELCYVFKSEDYFDEIHKVYVGAASQNDGGFSAKTTPKKIDYSTMVGAQELKDILSENNFMPIDIDEDCVVGWAERYYRENPKATKGDFLGESDKHGIVKVVGEIRSPKHFKGLINPYTAETNEKFKYLMDKLNDRLRKKDLGAFYTPMAYAEKACELVKMAIDRVPEGNDYIILDRCCGTGNLEQAVLNVLGEEVASHIVCSTYEYYEYKVLVERLGDKVRTIIPPTEANVEYANGCIMNADAMSEEYINNPIIKQYVDDPKCTIILFENPPYTDTTANTFANENGTKKKVNRGTSFVAQNYRNDKTIEENKASSREYSNLFIWSGFHYYMRSDTDSFIIFSPVKYFKSVGLAKKKQIKGFLFNRKHFHATESAISCILWSNEDDNAEAHSLTRLDIVDGALVNCGESIIKRCHYTLNRLFDKAVHTNDEETNVWCLSDGTEMMDSKRADVKSYYNDNIICCIGAANFPLAPLNRNLTRQTFYHHGMSFYVRKENYLRKLPLWVSKMFYQDDWYEKDIFYTTSDGGDTYTKDAEFLKQCLIYTCLSNQNKCLSFHGSDGRDYQNELCFDDNALALVDLKKFAASKKTLLNEDEKELLELWNKILAEAKATAGYDPKWNYGVYQITKELNTFTETGKGKDKQKVYDYPELNGDLSTLRDKLKAYYKKYITPKMFEYELIK